MTLPRWTELLGRLAIVSCLATLSTLFAQTATAQSCSIDRSGPEPKVQRAVSLKQLQARLGRCANGRSCSRDMNRFYNVTRIEGYIIDRENRDIVVLGSVDSSAPALDVENFIVALRNITRRYAKRRGNTIYYSYPAVSIDPNPRVLRELGQIMAGISRSSRAETMNRAVQNWRTTCEQPQSVRVLGIPFDTRFSATMVEADYFLKDLTNGKAKLDLPGFKSLSDMTLDTAVSQVLHGKNVNIQIGGLTRFWFTAGVNEYLEDDGVVLIQRSDVILLDEQEYVTKGRKIEPTGRVNRLARKFTCEFSKRYRAVAKRYPIYLKLENLFRWFALSRILVQRRAFDTARLDGDVLIRTFKIRQVHVDRHLDGIAEVKEFDHVENTATHRRTISLRLPSCGGVSMRIDKSNTTFRRDRDGQLAKITRRVLSARPDREAVFWNVR